jgi:hypothetical protein
MFENLSPDGYASTMLTLVGLGLLAIGTLATFVRFLFRLRREHPNLTHDFVADVKRGEGFTFHRQLKNTAQQQTQRPQMTWGQFLHLVNERPQEVPHVGIEGATGTTKTTLAQAIVATRDDKVIIITAKPDEHEWGGLPLITIDDDGGFFDAELAFQQILCEINLRLVRAKKRKPVGVGITVVLDDFTRLRSRCPSAGEVIELLGDQGRSIQTRLVLITRSKLVDALGIKGQSDWRDNLVFVSLTRQRKAFLEWDNVTYEVDTKPAYQLSKKPLSADRVWVEVEPVSDCDDVADDVPVHSNADNFAGIEEQISTSGTNGTPLSYAESENEEEETVPDGVPAQLTPEAIQILYNHWGSKNKVAKLLTGTKKKRLDIIDRALEQGVK